MIVSLEYQSKSYTNDCLVTIVIPTFDRIDNLLMVLSFLDENCSQDTCVYVVDNKSNNKPPIDLIQKVTKTLKVRYFSNKLHLGPDASVLRAIELASTPWIYLLGDSKIPKSNFLSTMESDCRTHPDANGIVYRYRNESKSSVSIYSIKELRENLTDYGDLFLGGNSIFSKKAVDTYFASASMYTLSRMPHAVFHLLSLNDGKEIYISEKSIISSFLVKPRSYDPKLSLLECWAQFALILSLPLPLQDLKILNGMILKMESLESVINFTKFSLLQIFRHKNDIRPHLLRIKQYRYLYKLFCVEKAFTYSLYICALIFCPLIKQYLVTPFHLKHKDHESTPKS